MHFLKVNTIKNLDLVKQNIFIVLNESFDVVRNFYPFWFHSDLEQK